MAGDDERGPRTEEPSIVGEVGCWPAGGVSSVGLRVACRLVRRQTARQRVHTLFTQTCAEVRADKTTPSRGSAVHAREHSIFPTLPDWPECCPSSTRSLEGG